MFESATLLDASLLPAMLIALTAGLLSFLSPCVLPVALPYLAFMGGVSVTDMAETGRARRKALLAAAFFVLGLSTVFLVMGFAFSAVGRLLLQYRDWSTMISGIVIMIFGAHFVGVYRIGFLDQEARVEVGQGGGSAFGAYLLGLAFAFGWTPCLGPILATILGLAASEGDIGRGTALLLVYALGLGIPFLLLAAFLPALSGPMALMKRHLDRIERISGLLLWTVGILILTDQFTVISNWLLDTFPVFQSLG